MFKLRKKRKKKEEAYYTSTPVPFITTEGIVIPMTREQLNEDVDELCYSLYKSHFERISTNQLKKYYAILKSQMEVWNTSDTAGHQFLNGAMLAIFSVAFGLFVKEFKLSIPWMILLAILMIPAGRFISSMVKAIMESSSTIAFKKEKATLIAIIVEDILKERKEGKAP